ncbi:MAG: AraC family transcriptional regulator [Bacteroidales bacterium]|nr:AraC family transcriptional regulator [Bacteroidales bacterium]MBQ7734914.1 AraC family transcriptional regulator [Bacteroidales bacterium]
MKNGKKKSGDLPILYDSEKIIKRTSWHDRELLIAEIGIYEDANIPEYFRTSHYAILFVMQGALSGKFNQLDIEIKAPAAVYIFNDHVLHYNSSTPDLKVRLLSFSPVIAEKLSLSLPYDKLHYAYVRPAAQLDASSMQTIMLYLDLIEELMQKENQKRQTTILHLVRSLLSFLYEFFTDSLATQKPLSRAEELTGRFLSLVDQCCHEHHDIKWYADELHLTPTYVANVVKQVTGSTAGDCISEILIRKAKSLLRTSTLSVQEISDRLGFQNQSHFGTFFRRAVGVSPKAFRTGGE